MSTSPSRSPLPPSPTSKEPFPEIQPFPYDLIPPGASARTAALDGMVEGAWGPGTADGGNPDRAAREAQARAQGRQEGQTEARKSFEDQLARERAILAEALAQFRRDRADYFQTVETEVVQLALSIARKILHRESQLDPLLLAGMVRVALEKIDGATQVVLRVHPQRAEEWKKYLTLQMEPEELPGIVEDPAQEPDRCVLQTSMGTAVVGIEVQLKEIEQGLMDLLAARPKGLS